MTIMAPQGSAPPRTTLRTTIPLPGTAVVRPVPSDRERWLHAATEITRQLLSVDGEDPLDLIARRVLEIAGCDLVCVVLPAQDGGRLMIEVAAGQRADDIVGASFSSTGSLCEVAMLSGSAALHSQNCAKSDVNEICRIVDLGSALAVPLVGSHRVLGAIVLVRRSGRRLFVADDVDMATAFANHAAIALELADARAEQRRLEVLDSQDRVASDLHDHIIQRVFASALHLQVLAEDLDDEQAGHVDRIVAGLNDTIIALRAMIFGLSQPRAVRHGSVRRRILSVVSEMTPALRSVPRVSFSGPVDAMVVGGLSEDVCAVAREALANVARHAGADDVGLDLTVRDGVVTLSVDDDGRGVGPTGRRSGLTNMARRATRNGGTLDVDALSDSATRPGTRLVWTAVLP